MTKPLDLDREKEEKEEIPIEVINDALRTAAILSFFEKEFGPMPHPLRFFKFRRWLDDFETFLKGVAFGEMLLRESREVRRDIREVEIDD